MLHLYRSTEPVLPPEFHRPNSSICTRLTALLKKFLLDPAVDTFKAIVAPRISNLRCLMLVAVANYGFFLFVLAERKLHYLYLRRVFEGFEGEDMAHLKVFSKV